MNPSHIDFDVPSKRVFRWTIWASVLFWALIFAAVANAATGLAVVTRDASVAGKLVKDVTPTAVYATPKAGDYVRVAALESDIWTTGVWKAWPVGTGDGYEVCTSDVPPETSINSGSCTSWDVARLVAINTTGTIELQWTAPTQNVDGSALTDLSGFWIYSGAKGSALTRLQQLPATATKASLTGYKDGTYEFSMTALAGEMESSQSGAVSVPVKIPVVTPLPNPPSALSVTQPTAYRISVETENRPRLFSIGTVPIGTACDRAHVFMGLNRVERTAVVLKQGVVRPAIAWAKCG